VRSSGRASASTHPVKPRTRASTAATTTFAPEGHTADWTTRDCSCAVWVSMKKRAAEA